MSTAVRRSSGGTAVHRLPATVLPRLLPQPAATSLTAHLRHFGPLPVAGSADGLGPGHLIEAVAAAGLRGRGGAGFPTASKLEAVRRSAARGLVGRRPPMVVANGTEGEPASAKDVTLLASAPHLVLDGVVAAALAIGAEETIVCIDRQSRRAATALQHALYERQAAGGDPVSLQLAEAPSHYVSGEESALVHWLNGSDAVPTTVPPRPFERGVGGRPTLVDNVETLAHVALIARFGSAWWRATGTADDPGTFLATVLDGRHRPRVYELRYGTRLGLLLEPPTSRPARVCSSAVTSGPGCVRTSLRRVPLSRAGLAGVGASLGCGAIAALPSTACPLLELARVTRWLANESAGQCGPCAFGLPAIAGALEALVVGDGPRNAWHNLQRWLPMVKGRGACKHPDGVVQFVSTGLDVFGEHVDEHRFGECALTRAAAVLPVPAHRGGWQ